MYAQTCFCCFGGISLLLLLCCTRYVVGADGSGNDCSNSNRYTHHNNGGQITEEFAVHLHPDIDPKHVATELGLEYMHPIGTLKCHHLFRARDNDHADQCQHQLAEHAGVKWFQRQVLRKRSSRTVIDSSSNIILSNTIDIIDSDSVSNTPPPPPGVKRTLSPPSSLSSLSSRSPLSLSLSPWDHPQDPLFPKQWHLLDTHPVGPETFIGMNVISAWALATGLGVCVAIVDDGIQHQHKDLRDNYIEGNSYNFNQNNLNILPTGADPHGTMCAGAVCAAQNDVCGVGVAFRANVSGLRILGATSHDAMEAAALTYKYNDNHIFSNSWGPTDDGQTLEGPGPLTLAALADGVQNGRHGLGAIYVWAVGNGATRGDNCNYDGYASSRYVLTVAAVDYLGHHPYYSEPCAASIVSAPSTGSGGTNIITTNMNFECDMKFSGTSAAAPLVAGVVALMLEANPNLTWRDVHHVMVNTARQNDHHDADWVENGANHFVNHKYGFGIVDAHAAVLLSKKWKTVAQEVTIEGPVVQVDEPIPDNKSSGIISSVEIVDNIKLEHVEIIFTAAHQARTDLRVVLYSPFGTPSYLSELHGTNAGYVLKVHLDATETIDCKAAKTKFSPTPTSWLRQSVDAPLVLIDPTTACEPPEIPLLFSIAVIQYDSTNLCTWTTKVQLAQEAGAFAVLIANTNSKAFELDGYESSIVVPVLMVGIPESQKIVEGLSQSKNITATLSTTVTIKNTPISFQDWVFSTVHLWDEESKGNWSLEVYDMHSAGIGVFNRWQLRLHGTNITNQSLDLDLGSSSSSSFDTSPNNDTPDNNTSEHSSFESDSVPTSLSTSYNPAFYFLSSFDRSITFVVIVALTVAVVAGWYLIEQRRERTTSTPEQV